MKAQNTETKMLEHTPPLPTLTTLRMLSLLIAIGLLGCKEEKVAEAPAPKIEGQRITIPADAPQKTSISVEEVNVRKTTVTHLTGRLVWDDDTTVRIFSPVAGRVDTILATLGQTVSPGDSLAKIASPDFGQAQADARRAAGDSQLAERALTRVRELYEHGATAKKELESAEADFTRAASEKDRAAARLTLYGGGNGAIDQMYPLKTPLAGVVVEKNINPGQEVRPDQMLANAPQLFAPLFVISDPTKLWLQLDVTELGMACLKPGQKLSVHTRAFPDRTFEGKLESVGNSLDPNTRTVKVLAAVENPDKSLKAEMYVTVDLTLDVTENTPPGVDVSSNAVFLKDNRHYVFIEVEPGKYERKVVKVGDVSEGNILVTDGISVGQKVVTQGCLLLQSLIDSDGTS